MDYNFQPSIPIDYNNKPVLISGKDSLAYDRIEYIVVNNDEDQQVFEIRYEYHTGSFKEALLIGNLLAIGFEDYFYLYDTVLNELMLKVKMEWYFGYLFYHDNLFYVADSCHVFCITKNGDIIWETENLAIDGVVIDKFTEEKIYGQGEHDPPNGWINFILDIKTGQTLKI